MAAVLFSDGVRRIPGGGVVKYPERLVLLAGEEGRWESRAVRRMRSSGTTKGRHEEGSMQVKTREVASSLNADDTLRADKQRHKKRYQ